VNEEFKIKCLGMPPYLVYSARTDSVLSDWLKINDPALFQILEPDMDIKYESKEEQPEGFAFFCKIALDEYDKANPFSLELKQEMRQLIRWLCFPILYLFAFFTGLGTSFAELSKAIIMKLREAKKVA